LEALQEKAIEWQKYWKTVVEPLLKEADKLIEELRRT
jgi:hypothetical protein